MSFDTEEKGTGFTGSPRALVVGYNAFDVTVPAGMTITPDHKHEVPFIRLGGGGPGATAAVAMSRLGASVNLVTALTDDSAGIQQRRELEAAGIDLGLCPLFKGQQSPMAVILVDPGRQQRTIFWSRGQLPQMDADLLDPGCLEGVDLLYHDGHEPQLVKPLARLARQWGMPVVMDAGGVRLGSPEMVRVSSDVVCSQHFAPELTGRKDPEEALRALAAMGPERVAVTYGENGLLALVDGQVFGVPAYDLPVVDTTGAGDVFHGAYAFALAQGGDFLHCLRFGAAAAALKCRTWGGRPGMPSLDEVEDVMASCPTLPLGPPLGSFPSAP